MKITNKVKNHDPVQNPAHYRSHPSGIECIMIAEHMSFNIGSVFKYCWRHGLKDSSKTIEDLRKAQFYLQKEIERLSK